MMARISEGMVSNRGRGFELVEALHEAVDVAIFKKSNQMSWRSQRRGDSVRVLTVAVVCVYKSRFKWWKYGVLLQEIAVATPTLAVDQQSTAGQEQGLMQLDRYNTTKEKQGKKKHLDCSIQTIVLVS